MRRRSQIKTDAVECARNMPALRHTVSEPFDIEQSEVVKWLCEQPAMRRYLLQHAFNAANEAKTIVYDPENGTWEGVGNDE